MTNREMTGWGLAAAGALCGVLAAYLKSDAAGGLAAASAALTSLSATWGYLNKEKPPAGK